MRTLVARLHLDWRTALSALLIVLSFPPYDLRFLIWFALVPWFAALYRAPSFSAATRQGLWLSVLMSLGGFHWVAYVLKQFAHLPWALAIIGLVLYSFIGQPQFYLLAGIHRGMQHRRQPGAVLPPLVIALAYTGVDWALPKLFVDTLGHSQYSAPWLRQAADLGGAALLTLLIYLVNDALWELWHRFRDRREPSAWPALAAAAPALATALALLAGGALYGRWRLEQVRAHQTGEHPGVQMAVIQANIGDIEKLRAESGLRSAVEQVLSAYYALSRQALEQEPRPEVLIWPETAYPSTFRTPMNASELQRDQQLETFARDHGVPLLFGGYDTREEKDYNALFLLSGRRQTGGLSGNEDLQVYRKNILLPFGEFIPLAENIGWIRRAFPQVGYFGRGPGPQVFPVAGFKVSPIICYEALFPNFVIGALRQGSQLILNVTNDSWFGPHGEPQLHLALSAFRSIETRLPQLRATNTGISALITPDGEIRERTALFEPAILNVRVPLVPPLPTLVGRLGDWFGPTALCLGLLGLGLALRAERARDEDDAEPAPVGVR